MRKLGLALCFALLGLAPAQPQAVSWPPPAGTIGFLCVYNTVLPTYTNGQAGFVQCDSSGRPLVSGSLSLAGTTSNASSAVATSGTNLPTVSYNYGFNGTTWDQLQVDASKNLKATVIAASGAYASGAFASGSVASGALASGSMVDLVALSAPVAPATATATKSILGGCQATSAGITPTTGQQAAVDCDLNNNLLVSSGGAPNLTTAQVSVATSNTSVVAARALRRSVTITNITGTQQVFCSGTVATAGNGQLIPAIVGANWTVSTTAAINCIAITGAQTVSTAETF